MPDQFEAMRIFIAVADLRGFAPASRRLTMSPSVVTRQVAGLEDRLGVRLLHRTTRSVRLTEPGARYLERARRIMADVEEAELAARDEQSMPRGLLTVAAPLLFGRMHVAPLLSDFLAAYPQASVDLQLSDRYAHLVDDGIDVAIRIGDLPSSNLTVRTLGRTRRVLVASPGYLAAAARPLRTPADLPGHALIAFRAMTPGREWLFHQRGGGTASVAIEPRLVTDSGEVAIHHALGGGGVTAALCYQVDAALAAGTLVEVLAEFAPPPMPIRVVFPTSHLLPAKVRAFLDLAARAAPRWRFSGRAGEPTD